MKKLLDKFVVQSLSKRVVVIAGLLAAVVVIAVLAWYFVTIGGSRLMGTETTAAPMDVNLAIRSACSAIVRVLTIAVFTGLFTRTLQTRKDRISDGTVDYGFVRNYTLVIGYDVQTRHLIRALVARRELGEIVLLSDSDARRIQEELQTDLTADELRRVFVLRRNLTARETYARMTIRGAREIYLLGDAEASGRDGAMLRAQELLAEKAATEPAIPGAGLIRTYLHLEMPGLFSRLRTRQLAMDRLSDVFDLELVNVYDSWVWRCWSDLSPSAQQAGYLPLRFKPGASRVELFVLGYGKVGKAVVETALQLANYGATERASAITVSHDGSALDETFPAEDVRAALPEVTLAWHDEPVVGEASCRRILAAAAREDTAVTIVITGDDPDEALRTYAALPTALRRMEVSVLLWMPTSCAALPDLELMKVDGDRVSLRCFGMTDLLPWYQSGREANGVAINYFYSILDRLPEGTDPSLFARAEAAWDPAAARALWLKIPRWAKGSSVSGGDVFKERRTLLGNGTPSSETLLRLLRTEHNRWWTERLLAGWKPCPPPVDAADKAAKRQAFLHWNLVPFEALDAATQDVDKINLAALAVC